MQVTVKQGSGQWKVGRSDSAKVLRGSTTIKARDRTGDPDLGDVGLRDSVPSLPAP